MRRFQARPNYARLVPAGGGLALESTYDADMVRDLKGRIPPEERRWDKNSKCWEIAPQHGALVARLCEMYLGITVLVPTVAATLTVETRLVQLEYLGRTKDRGQGERSAFGWADGSWRLLFPEAVLREWFDAVPQVPGEKPTLFAVLLCKVDCTSDELRSAYRRMVKIWHPDVNRSDPDAAEQFKVIQHAWEVLSDPVKRKRYEVGLSLQAGMSQQTRAETLGLGADDSLYEPDGYRSPLRCGWVLLEGVEQLRRFVVSKIIEWQDVLDEEGRIMSTSWPMGSERPEVIWQQ